jgi:hypothetical protein
MPNQDASFDELNTTADQNNEGESSNADNTATSTIEQEANDIDELIAPLIPEKEDHSKKVREGLIEKQLDKLLNAEDEYQREEILQKFPKLQDDILAKYNKIVGNAVKHTGDFVSREEYESLKAQIEGKKQLSEKEEANAFLKQSLKDLNLPISEFKEEYGEEFTSEMAELLKRGFTQKEAITRTLKYIGVSTNKKATENARGNATITNSKGGSNIGFSPVSIAKFDTMSAKEQSKYLEESKKNVGAVKFL